MVQPVRKSDIFLTIFAVVCLLLAGLLLIHPRLAMDSYAQGLASRRRLVSQLQLTDLCLFTEARYTRHLSQADLYGPFQDFPMAFDHFPSGSLVRPPDHLINDQ